MRCGSGRYGKCNPYSNIEDAEALWLRRRRGLWVQNPYFAHKNKTQVGFSVRQEVSGPDEYPPSTLRVVFYMCNTTYLLPGIYFGFEYCSSYDTYQVTFYHFNALFYLPTISMAICQFQSRSCCLNFAFILNFSLKSSINLNPNLNARFQSPVLNSKFHATACLLRYVSCRLLLVLLLLSLLLLLLLLLSLKVYNEGDMEFQPRYHRSQSHSRPHSHCPSYLSNLKSSFSILLFCFSPP